MVLAMAALAVLLTSCGGEKTAQLSPVAAPSWYADSAAYVNQAAIKNNMIVNPQNIVMIGDDYIADGLWREFYADTTIKNHGISGTTTEHILYNIDNVAYAHPAKIFFQTGYRDITNGRSAKDAAKTMLEVFKRVKAISPETALYFISVSTNEGEFGTFNSMMKSAADGYTYIDITEMNDKMDIYSWDSKMHLNGYGYEALAKILAPFIGREPVNVAVETPAGESRHAQMVSIFKSIPSMTKKIVMVGDCYTGDVNWSELLPFPAVIDRAIDGDAIKDVEDRLDCLGSDDPAKVFLLIGINDIIDMSKSVSDIWKDYQSLIKTFKSKYPDTQLYIQSVVAIRENNVLDIDWRELNNRAAELNKLLEAGTEGEGYFFIDLNAILADEEGILAQENTFDGVHFTPDAYFKWATELLKGPRLIIMDNKLINKDLVE